MQNTFENKLDDHNFPQTENDLSKSTNIFCLKALIRFLDYSLFINFLQSPKQMREIKIRISEEKLHFFNELLANLGFEIAESIDIPETHKQIVRERIKNAKPEDLKSWKEARVGFNFRD